MLKNLLYGFTFLSFLTVSAQSVVWVNTPEVAVTNLVPTGYLSATDANGNVYFSGLKDNPFSYTETFGNLHYQKYTQAGSSLFSKTITGIAVLHQMQSDSQGNMLLAIEHLNTLTFDALSIPNPTELPQHVLLKVTSEGELLWHKVLDIPELGVNTFKAIAFDADNSIYIGYDNYDTCYIEKLNSDGETLQLIVQENVNRLTSLAIDSEGNIYATGSCANINSVYAGVSQPTQLDYTVYLVKYSSAGTFQWINYVEDITCSAPMVQVDANNAVYWAAETFLPVQLDQFTMEGPSGGGTDFFLAKLNANGDYLWAKEIPGNGSVELGHRNFLQVDQVGGICLSGTLSGGVTQWSDLITTDTGTFSNREVVVLRYDENGSLLYAFTGGGSQNDSGHSIALDAGGEIFLTGMTRGNAQLGWYSFTPPNATDYSPFIARISPFTLSVPEPEKNSILIYPNPVTNLLTVQTSQTIVNLTVYSLNGQRIQLPQNSNQLDFSGVANGVYVVEVAMGGGLERVKVVR